MTLEAFTRHLDGAETAFDLVKKHPNLRQPLIDGLLRRGEVANIVAAPKTGKSWAVDALALCVCVGIPWLGLTTTPGRVLLIDGELHPETLAFRLKTVGAQLNAREEATRNLLTWRVRGKDVTIDKLPRALSGIRRGDIDLIILDPLYRFFSAGGEENSNDAMTFTYNTLDQIAESTGAAMIAVHHTSKGDQSGKSVTDVGAGGGAQSRAVDTHLVMRPHEREDAVVVAAEVRSWEKFKPFVVRWKRPGWDLAPDLDPADLRKASRRTKSARSATTQKRSWTPEEFATRVVGTKPRIREEIIADARAAGMSRSEAESLLKRADSAGLVKREPGGPSEAHRFAALATEAGGALLSNPTAPGAACSGGCGGDARPPSPPTGRRRGHE